MSKVQTGFPDVEPEPDRHQASNWISGVLRGGKVYSQQEVREGSFELYGDDPRSFPLGSVLLPFSALFNHLLFLGTSGAGKTTLINQVKRYLLNLVEDGLGRLFIWDFKGEERRHLEPYTIEAPIHYLNPLLGHGAGIDLAAELTTPFAANQFAIDMISPEAADGSHGMEWVRAGRSVFSHVIQALHKAAPGRWRFIDVLEACQTMENLRRVLSMTRLGRARLSEMLGNRSQSRGVMFTLQGSAEEMWPLASAMARTKNISLQDWIQGSGIVVLQHVDKYEDALRPFERWVFGQAVRLALTEAEQQSKFTMFFLDEARHCPAGRHLMKLATAGRGKGCGIVMGLTDIEGLKDQLKPEKAAEVLGSFSTGVFMMNANPGTAEWVSQRAGVQLLSVGKRSVTESTNIETNVPRASAAEAEKLIQEYLRRGEGGPPINGWGVGQISKAREDYNQLGRIPERCPVQRKETNSRSVQTSMEEVERAAFFASELMHRLPKAEVIPGKGLVTSAFVVTTYLGMFPMVTTHMDDEEATLKPAPAGKYPNVERPEREMDFEGWTQDDEKRLNLPPVPPKKRRPGSEE